MRRYLVISGGGHVFLLAGWLISATLLSKPRMSYYAVDLVSSMPAAAPSGSQPTKVVEEVPKPTPRPPVVEERKLPAKEVIKVQAKPKKVQAPPKKQGLNLKAALAVLDNQNKTPSRAASGVGTSGSPITAQAGQPFPYPWYLKVISDRLHQKWDPPADFAPDTACTIDFVIHRDGQVSGISISKSSRDSTFDELARRAVLYSNPLPPLPSGYPEERLNVHMTFQGK
jgi:TonB family protein